jgi:hypothetical protein
MRALLEMTQQIYWQEQDLNIHSKNLNQPVASQSKLPKEQSETDRQKLHQTMGINN